MDSSPLLSPLLGSASTPGSRDGSPNYSSTENLTQQDASLSKSPSPSALDYDGSIPDDAEPEHDNNLDEVESDAGDFTPRTSAKQTFLHLVKGYIGPGCLSLPWAVSQLGFGMGTIAIFVISYWSSYNCWTIVKIKRYIEHQQQRQAGIESAETKSESASSVASSALTYPDVGEWAYGDKFEAFLTGCICTQQLAVCTVFFSFIGENILAVSQLIPNAPSIFLSHVGVMTVALPFILALAFIPNLNALTPVIGLATVFLFGGFGLLGYVVFDEWGENADPVEVKLKEVPLALCAILYSYEGICLILPIESTMKWPRKFKSTFWLAMTCVAVVFATVASSCVYAFGEVTSGSITAFLLQKYKGDESLIIVLMMTNTAVSLSVLLTYPLQLYPTYELVGPKARAAWWKYIQRRNHCGEAEDSDLDGERDLTGFDIMPTLPEHGLPIHDDFENTDADEDGDASLTNHNGPSNSEEINDVTSITEPLLNLSDIPGDTLWLRTGLVFLTYVVAAAVPNVQALISLAGALAGSSTALLIPPMLELALIDHMDTKLDAATRSPRISRQHTSSQSSFKRLCRCDITGKFWRKKLKCFILFWIGFTFMTIGVYASVSDIVKIWLES